MIMWNKWDREILSTNEQHFSILCDNNVVSSFPTTKRLKEGYIVVKLDDNKLKILRVEIAKINNVENITFLTESGEHISTSNFGYWLDQDFSSCPILK